MNVTDLLDLAMHMAWAEAMIWTKTLTAPRARDDERLRATFHHVHLVQHLFVRAWRGESFTTRPDFTSADSLAAWGLDTHRLIQGYLTRTPAPSLDAAFREPWTPEFEKLIARPAASHTLGESILQAMLHSLHHRGQLCIRLRELEVEPPTVDFIVWLWAGRPTADWTVIETRDATD